MAWLQSYECEKMSCPFKHKVETTGEWIGADDIGIMWNEYKLEKPYYGCDIRNDARCMGEDKCPIMIYIVKKRN